MGTRVRLPPSGQVGSAQDRPARAIGNHPYSHRSPGQSSAAGCL